MGDHSSDEANATTPRAPIRRAVVISLAILGLLIGGLAVASWLSADPETLPFDYDGFN